jgi:glycosyltransferase involved in cell wall biosynthesis
MVLATATEPTTERHTQKRFRLLAVTSEVPWPLNTGGHIRTFHLLRALVEQFRVRLVVPVRTEQQEAVAILHRHAIQVIPAAVPPRRPWREALRIAAAAIRRKPYVLYERHHCRAVRAVLRTCLREERPDLCYLDHLDSLVYAPLFRGLPSVIDLHNVYSMLARRTGQEAPFGLKRLYLTREAKLLARMEVTAARQTNVLFSVSEEERDYFHRLGACAAHLVPNGVDCAAYEALPLGRSSNPPLILFVGALSWGPNAAAVQFLAREVLPQVQQRLPGVRLRIVGRDPDAAVRALGQLPGVEVAGSVPDVIPHLREASLLAVPLESGGGTRLKILEAFAAGLPVVSTPVGCEGLRGRQEEHLLVAERAAFAAAVLRQLTNPGLAGELARNARLLAQQEYDWKIIGGIACRALLAQVERI